MGGKYTWKCENWAAKVIRGRQKTPITPPGKNQALPMALLIFIFHALKSCQLSLRQTAAAFHTILYTTESCPLTLYRTGYICCGYQCCLMLFS